MVLVNVCVCVYICIYICLWMCVWIRTYEFEQAQEIYRLVRSSPIADMRNKARALALGTHKNTHNRPFWM